MSLALSAIVCVAGTTFGQDGSKAAASGKKPVSVKTIRPFTRNETPANQAPNLYDATSDEFNYFREDLGRQEMSTKQRQRLEQIASRVVYADPMDKPAEDGSPFVDIYSLDEVIADGKAFEGLDDPDFIYSADENNLLAEIAKECDVLTTVLQIATGVGATVGEANKGMDSGYMGTPGSGPAMPMPTVTMGPVMMEGGQMSGGDIESKEPSGAKPAAKAVGPSNKDDSALIFPGEDVTNPFASEENTEAEAAADDFDLFTKEEREWKASEAPAAPKTMGSGGYGSQD